jgi:dihydrofolate reductase
MNVSLDGYVAGPDGDLDWIFRSMDPVQTELVTEFLREIDTVLLGRAAYLEQAAYWPGQSGEMADLLNRHAKVVFSKTLDTLEWSNSRLATGDAADEIARLKAQPGKDVYVSGGATLAQSLSRLGLIDEYRLFVRPVVLGSGKPLFTNRAAPLELRLTRAQAFDTGAVLLIYRSATPAPVTAAREASQPEVAG